MLRRAMGAGEFVHAQFSGEKNQISISNAGCSEIRRQPFGDVARKGELLRIHIT